MKKNSNLAFLIGAVVAIFSTAVLIIVFWDKLLSLCPCKSSACDHTESAEEESELSSNEETITYTAEETADFADLQNPQVP